MKDERLATQYRPLSIEEAHECGTTLHRVDTPLSDLPTGLERLTSEVERIRQNMMRNRDPAKWDTLHRLIEANMRDGFKYYDARARAREALGIADDDPRIVFEAVFGAALRQVQEARASGDADFIISATEHLSDRIREWYARQVAPLAESTLRMARNAREQQGKAHAGKIRGPELLAIYRDCRAKYPDETAAQAHRRIAEAFSEIEGAPIGPEAVKRRLYRARKKRGTEV